MFFRSRWASIARRAINLVDASEDLLTMILPLVSKLTSSSPAFLLTAAVVILRPYLFVLSMTELIFIFYNATA